MYEVHHVGVVLVKRLVEADDLLVFAVALRLVEHAEHLVQPVVDLAMQQRNLHDDAVVYQAVDEGVLVSVGHLRAIVVEGFVAHIDDGLVYVADAVPQEIHGHHGEGVSLSVAFLLHVLLRVVLCREITAEAQGLRVEPCLLQFDEHEVLLPVVFLDARCEVDAEHRQVVACDVGVLMAPHLHTDDLLLEQGGQDGPGDALILHQELEHGVVNRIGYTDLHGICFGDKVKENYCFPKAMRIFF